MHHKRRRPKHQRAGCLMCSPHKDERRKQREFVATRVLLTEAEPAMHIAREIEAANGYNWDEMIYDDWPEDPEIVDVAELGGDEAEEVMRAEKEEGCGYETNAKVLLQ